MMGRTVAEGECVVFQGYRNPKGYGAVHVGGRGNVFAHRLAWEHHHGPVPGRKCVMHSCDNPPCVRIEHLRVGTNAENSADMVAKGRSPRGSRGERSGRARYTDAQVEDLLDLVEAGMTVAGAARRLGINTTTASGIVSGSRRVHQARPALRGALERRRVEVRHRVALMRAEGMTLPAIAKATGHNTGALWRMIERFKRDEPALAEAAGLVCRASRGGSRGVV